MILGIGVDILNISRVDEKIASRILTKEELEIYNKLTFTKKEWLCGRFAAKEAIYKALPDDSKITINNISVLAKNDRPVCEIKDFKINISISHEKEYVVAYVIIEK